jgi:hypothetical protein
VHVLLIDNVLITSLIPILLFEYFKEKSIFLQRNQAYNEENFKPKQRFFLLKIYMI